MDLANARRTICFIFTLEQIDELHASLGSANTLAEYVRALKAIGIGKFDSYLVDGHSEFVGEHGQVVISPPAHERLSIAETSDRTGFLRHLSLHDQGQTSYLEMSRGLAESGIEKWTVDTSEMRMIFYDRAGQEILVDKIK